jgi:hypothetical protein
MRYLILLLSLGLASTLAGAQQAGSGMAQHLANAAFTAVEVQLIEEYYRNRPGSGQERVRDDDAGKVKSGQRKGNGSSGSLPPGLAKRDVLPPGLQMQLEKNGTLPPGLAKRDLPGDLERRLPLRIDGHQRVIVDRDVILVETATGIILDILRGVLGGS